MVKIRIGESEEYLSNIGNDWIVNQLKRRQKEGMQVCVKITIKNNNIDMVLSTKNCSSGSSGGRKPNEIESNIFKIWHESGLDEFNYSPQNILDFINRIHSYI